MTSIIINDWWFVYNLDNVIIVEEESPWTQPNCS